MEMFDVVIVGAGAAGLFCSGVAGQLGQKVLLVDHSDKVAEKIRISGGGRCNFTNTGTTAANFLSENPRFCRSALARYTAQDFVALVKSHGIAFHEKHKGQLFCDRSAEDLIAMLLAECDKGGVTRWQGCAVAAVRYSDGAQGGMRYQIDTARGTVQARALVIATGGLSIPKIGATDFGYRIAKQFGLPLVPTRPALVPLTFSPEVWTPFAALAGLSLPVQIAAGDKKTGMQFAEDLLFTHRGLSGPGVLQISSYWREGNPIRLNLSPEHDPTAHLLDAKASASRKRLATVLADLLPSRLADTWVAGSGLPSASLERGINDLPDKVLSALGERVARWDIAPDGTEGYRKAEVTAGGVATTALSGQTMESSQPGLYFIGEVVDVTGWLGGYNFQWAWASAYACAMALPTGANAGHPL